MLALFPAPASQAVPTVDLSWNVCSPIQVDRTVTADWLNSVLVSVTGQDESHQGYQFFIVLQDVDGQVPDAWRFDVEGCQPAGRVEIEHLWPDMIKSCLPLQGTLASTQTSGYASANPGYPAQPMVAYLTNSYPDGQYAPDPSRRYALGRVRFDHSASVPGTATLPGTCGGLDRPMCLRIVPGLTGYRAIDGTLRLHAVGNGTATSYGGCQPVPALGSTWGAIKGQYRR